jgi:3-hydroxybutyrate dehydrogenase
MTGGSLSGKVAVVTGGGSGIGRAIALRLARDGAAVCVADLNPEAGRTVAAEIGGAGGVGRSMAVDVADSASVQAMIAEVATVFGRLSILINNAGLQFVAPIVDYPEEKWQQLIDVMLTGTFLCTKYALPQMYRHSWGRIVNLASAHGLIASPYKAAYTAAKHGIVGFTKAAAWEAAAAGVTVNAICPGYTRTPLVENQIPSLAREHEMSDADVVERIMLNVHAVKRLIEPDEIAAMVAYLCSDAAAMVTGTAVPIDAGWTAR